MRILLGLILVILLVPSVSALTYDLNVTSCETTTCTASQLNTNDTTGTTIADNTVIQPVMSDLPGNAASVSQVILRIRWTEGADTNGNNRVNLQSDTGNSNYCTEQTDAQGASGDEYRVFNFTSCGLTVAQVNDMQVYYMNDDAGKSGSTTLTFVDVLVEYVEANFAPDWTNNLAANTSSGFDNDVVNFNATGTDPEGDNYYLSVCSANSIINGSPGTCSGGGRSLCNSTSTSSAGQASCTYTLADADVGTLNAYGFLCDVGSSTCNTSTTVAITVTSNAPTVTGGLADSPDPQNVSQDITFTLTADDPDSNNYWLTVCKTDSITENLDAAGTCAAGQTLCTSTSTADAAQASCTNTTVAAMTNGGTAYGFACDSHGECSASSSTTYNVTSNSPYFSVALADTPDPVYVGQGLQFTATGTDPNTDSYRLTVCKTNSITPGFPGTCAASQTLCTSGSTSSGSQASCTNTTVPADIGTFTAYGFVCDSWGVCNLTSSSTSVTIESNEPAFTANLADSPDPVQVGSNITYTATATDPESDAYSLTVCRTNSITEGYPGSCAASQLLCNVTGVSSASQASCDYTTLESDDGTLTAYGFVCDSTGQCNLTSTSTTTTVKSLPPTWTVNIGDTPDSLYAGATITYTATGSDPEGGNYYLTVCRTDALTNASPGTCVGGAGNILCTSSSFADDAEASCTYDTVVGDIGTLNAYGFLCDTKSECSSSTTESTTVLDPPIAVTLTSPLNITYNTTTIYVNGTTDEPASSWKYSLDGAANISLTINTTVEFAAGQHTIVLWANDSGNNWGSDTQYFRVLNMSYNGFNGQTTQFGQQGNPNNVCPVLENTAYGIIRWNSCFNVRNADLDNNVYLQTGRAGINAANLPNWNTSANITLYRVNLTEPAIVDENNVRCTHCTLLSYNAQNVTFNVSHFSNYTALENASLNITDDTDTVTKYADEQIRFYANYTNSTNNPITGATCLIGVNISGGWTSNSMTYNGTLLVYEYNRSFSLANTYNWNVTCSQASYPTINLTDTVIVSGTTPYWSVNLTAGPSPVNSSASVTFNATAVDPDGDNYRLTVCRTNAITNGYPGTCPGGTLCTSGVTANGSQAQCSYTTTIDDIGSLTGYGFLCDAGSTSCNATSTSASVTVLDNLPFFGCTFKNSCNSSEVDVFRAENETGGYYNAHVQLWNYSGTAYAYTLCCQSESGYALNNSCSNSSTKVVWRAALETNSHIQTNASGSYSNDICLGAVEGNFTCEYTSSACSTSYKPVLSMASSEGDNTTNAHVANYSFYDLNTCCRLNRTILLNTPPGPVTLDYPADGNTTVFERTVTLNWTVAEPTEGDPVTYSLSLNTSGSCAVEHQETGIATNEFTTNELCVDQVYNWTVQACDDDGCSVWATQFNFTIESVIGIQFLQNTSTFAASLPGDTNDTEAGPGQPMRLENTGNVVVNVSLNATAALFTNAGLGTSAFQFKVAANESSSFDAGPSQTSYANITATLANAFINLKYQDASDDGLIHYRVTVPADEPAGTKSTTVNVRATVS